MHALLTITWDMGKGIDLGFFTLRFYSLLFASGFVIGYFIMKRMFQKEGVSQEKLDSLVTYTVIATIVGARLGHVFFYQWDYFSKHIVEIFKIWEGGLASHGAAIAIIIAIVWYSRKVLKKNPLWMLDRLVITIALAGALIRLGNWFNSEIYGNMGNSDLQTVFVDPPREAILRNFEAVESIQYEFLDQTKITDTLDLPLYKMTFDFVDNADKGRLQILLQNDVTSLINGMDKENKNILIPSSRENPIQIDWKEGTENIGSIQVIGIPRAPTQLYEALGYFLIFLILYRLYLVRSLALSQGFIFGAFLILVWGFRFAIEFAKENQVSAEEGLTFNIGQLLSIPLVLAGIYFIATANKRKLHAE